MLDEKFKYENMYGQFDHVPEHIREQLEYWDDTDKLLHCLIETLSIHANLDSQNFDEREKLHYELLTEIQWKLRQMWYLLKK